MFGAEVAADSDEFSRLEAVLDRQAPVESLQMLHRALSGKKVEPLPLNEIAVALDANAFLRLSNHPRRTDIVDYFASKHTAPLIIPGQVVQEFWNNQFAAMQSISSNLKSKFEAVNVEVSKIDGRFGDFSAKFQALTSEMEVDFGYVRDSKTIVNLASICEMLVSKACVSYVPRARFDSIATHRKKTKTPPGFKDNGDGDFFVWADLLLGLSRERGEGQKFKHCVFITDDRKPDWSLGGLVHPILSAELNSLVEATFDIWGLDRLGKEVAAFLDLQEGADATHEAPPEAAAGEADS